MDAPSRPGGATQFITFSAWESVQAIRAFAGEDIDTAIYYPEDDRYILERDATVSHYEVVDRRSGHPAGYRART